MQRLCLAGVLLVSGALAVAKTPVKDARVSVGTPTVSSDYDGKALATVVTGIKKTLLGCYTKVLAKSNNLEGVLTAKFTITADGAVSSASGSGLDREVERCFATAIGKLRFTKPADGKPVDVTLPIECTSGYVPQGGAFASLTGTGDISSGFDDANIYGGLLGNTTDDANGGFGYGSGGFGPGGGGTGWGTIGTGRYGTIGHGSGGSGSGYGVGGGRGGMRGRGSVPTVSIGQPNAQGDLDKAIIRRYIKRNIQKIQYCYEKQLLNKKGLSGTVNVAFTINSNGLVTDSTAKGMDTEVATCIAGVIKQIEFPKPKSNDVKVNYPFTFRPAETDDTAAKPTK